MSDPQRPNGLRPSRLLCPWDFPGKSTGVGCRCLLHCIDYCIQNVRVSVIHLPCKGLTASPTWRWHSSSSGFSILMAPDSCQSPPVLPTPFHQPFLLPPTQVGICPTESLKRGRIPFSEKFTLNLMIRGRFSCALN